MHCPIRKLVVLTWDFALLGECVHSFGLEGAIGTAVVIGRTTVNGVAPCGTGTIGDRHFAFMVATVSRLLG